MSRNKEETVLSKGADAPLTENPREVSREVWGCGFFWEGDCTDQDSGYYGLKCPFNKLTECATHNDNLSRLH
jgi:hypothetical protein